MTEEIEKEVKDVIQTNVEAADKTDELLNEYEDDAISNAVEDVMRQVVPELDSPKRVLTVLVSCRSLAQNIGDEELEDMCIGNIKKLHENHFE